MGFVLLFISIVLVHNFVQIVSIKASTSSNSNRMTNVSHQNSSFLNFLDTTLVMTDEQRLLAKILRGYDPASRPTFIASNSVQVGFQFTLIQISQLDEVNQVLTLNVWIEQEWIDERLKWNPEDYNNLTKVRIPCQKLWLPDIVLYNSADDYKTDYMQSKAMVQHNGNVFWPPPAKLRSTCKIDITYFPFDDQACMMKFGSWAYDGWQVNITKRHDEVDISNYVENGEWDLLKVTVERFEITYPCCDEPYPDLRFTIFMRRRTLYYLFNIIFPCLWLTVLSLISFWLPPDSGEKITLGITVLLAFSVFMLLIAENMPATSEFVPLIGIYLTVTMAMTSLSIILTVLVLHLHHAGPNHPPIPDSIRHFFFDYVAHVFCLEDVRRYQAKRQRIRTDPSRLSTHLMHSDFREDSVNSHLYLASIKSPKHSMENEAIDHKTDTMISIRTNPGQIDRTEEAICLRSYRQMQNDIPPTIYEQLIPCKPQHNCTKSSRNCSAESSVTNSSTKLTDYVPLQTKKVSISLECLKEHNQNGSNLNPYKHLNKSVLDDTNNNRISEFNLHKTTQSSNSCDLVQKLTCLVAKAELQQEMLCSFLNQLYTKHQIEEQTIDTVNEWRMLALIVDRMLFWLFLSVGTVATTVILIIMPLFKPNYAQ